MKKIIFASIFFCLLFVGACTKPEPLTGKDAERIGMERYAEFVKKQNLSPEQFEKPGLSYSPESQAWLLSFKTKEGYPRKFIGIIVTQTGKTEVSFQE